MIMFRMNKDQITTSGTISKSGQPVGAFWANGDGRWSVRIDGSPVAVMPKTDIRRFVYSALSD